MFGEDALTRGREGQLLCRFSDAGSDEPSTRSGGRRLKSAKARNRGKWGTVGARALWGFSRGVRLGEVGQSARPDRLPRRMGVGDGPHERIGRCRTGLAV